MKVLIVLLILAAPVLAADDFDLEGYIKTLQDTTAQLKEVSVVMEELNSQVNLMDYYLDFLIFQADADATACEVFGRKANPVFLKVCDDLQIL